MTASFVKTLKHNEILSLSLNCRKTRWMRQENKEKPRFLFFSPSVSVFMCTCKCVFPYVLNWLRFSCRHHDISPPVLQQIPPKNKDLLCNHNGWSHLEISCWYVVLIRMSPVSQYYLSECFPWHSIQWQLHMAFICHVFEFTSVLMVSLLLSLMTPTLLKPRPTVLQNVPPFEFLWFVFSHLKPRDWLIDRRERRGGREKGNERKRKRCTWFYEKLFSQTKEHKL